MRYRILKLREGYTQCLSSTWIFCIVYLLSRTRKQDPLREHNSLLSNITAISYITACISIQCPTVQQILIKLHHSEEKEWSPLSSSGWNDFIFCLAVWWMMKCWPKNKKWTNKTANSAGIPKGQSLEKEKKRLIFYQQCLFCCKSIENMPTHINRRKTLYELFFLEDICQHRCSPETISVCFVYVRIKYLYLFCPCFGKCNSTINTFESPHVFCII